jgi:hypothetical protein
VYNKEHWSFPFPAHYFILRKLQIPHQSQNILFIPMFCYYKDLVGQGLEKRKILNED